MADEFGFLPSGSLFDEVGHSAKPCTGGSASADCRDRGGADLASARSLGDAMPATGDFPLGERGRHDPTPLAPELISYFRRQIDRGEFQVLKVQYASVAREVLQGDLSFGFPDSLAASDSLLSEPAPPLMSSDDLFSLPTWRFPKYTAFDYPGGDTDCGPAVSNLYILKEEKDKPPEGHPERAAIDAVALAAFERRLNSTAAATNMTASGFYHNEKSGLIRDPEPDDRSAAEKMPPLGHSFGFDTEADFNSMGVKVQGDAHWLRFLAILEFSCECLVSARLEWEKKPKDADRYAPDPDGVTPDGGSRMRAWMDDVTAKLSRPANSPYCYIAAEDHPAGSGNVAYGTQWRVTGFVEWEHATAMHKKEVRVVPGNFIAPYKLKELPRKR